MHNNIDKKILSNITKVIIGISILITVISLYILISIEMPKKALAGADDVYDDDVKIGGSFELVDQDGHIFNSDKLHGKLSLIYFGFTHCPDICPAALQKMTEVINILDEYHIDVTPVFIAIDSQRDTPAILKEYLKNFHHKFIGLTGTHEQIKDVADKFKVYYAISGSNEEEDKSNYMIDHSSFLYLMDEQGKYIKHFYLDTHSNEIIEFFKK
jgi:protein SCO1/2